MVGVDVFGVYHLKNVRKTHSFYLKKRVVKFIWS